MENPKSNWLWIMGIGLWILLFILITPNSPLITSATAAEATQSATPSASLIDKLNALKTEIASKANQFKKEVDKKIQNKLSLGSLKVKEQLKLILETKGGEKTILINEFTTFDTGKTDSLKDLKLADYIVALGDIDDQGKLTAKKVQKVAKPKESPLIYLWGMVEKISASTLVVKTPKGEINQILTTSKTIYSTSKDEAKLSDIKKNDLIIAVGEKSEQSLKARFIYKLDLKQATPAAKPSN